MKYNRMSSNLVRCVMFIVVDSYANPFLYPQQKSSSFLLQPYFIQKYSLHPIDVNLDLPAKKESIINNLSKKQLKKLLTSFQMYICIFQKVLVMKNILCSV